MTGAFRVYLRTHDGQVSDKTDTASPAVAVAAFRELLARQDLIGCAVSAVFRRELPQRQTVYFSRFDRDAQRLLPDDQIDPFALGGADDLTRALVARRRG